jgi:hypothetical protein
MYIANFFSNEFVGPGTDTEAHNTGTGTDTNIGTGTRPSSDADAGKWTAIWIIWCRFCATI